jgi:hypothetical protein
VSDEWRWLEETATLQREAYGVDPSTLEGAALADFVIWNVVAATDELHEMLDEVSWKPWVTERGHKDKAAAIHELVDVAHFVANLAVAMGCTDEEWTRIYREKMAVNRARQRAGYDGISTKCTQCGRALDDATTKCTTTWCADEEVAFQAGMRQARMERDLHAIERDF